MIVKIQDDNQQDKHIIEAASIRWNYNSLSDGFIIIELYDSPHVLSKQVSVRHGDRVFIMNDQGKTVDSKRIIINEE